MAGSPGGMKTFYLTLAGVAVLGLAVLGYQLTRSKTVSIPANVAVLAADTAGFRGYILGADSAPVEIAEYADYQCPGCQQFDIVTFPDVRTRLIETGRVRWRYRDFPLDHIHSSARIAAHAAACADEQGRYWPMHELIYQGQPDWSSGNAGSLLRGYATSVGLDLGKYDACMGSAKYAGRIQASYEEGVKVGVGSTPTLLIGGRLYGGLGYDEIRRLVDSLAPSPAQ